MPIKRKKKTQQEIDRDKEEREKMWRFFNSLWGKLPKIKRCWNCGRRIYGENLSLYWDHLCEKETYPELKYKEENMFFCCGDCHTNKTNGWPGEKHKEAILTAKQKLLNAENQ